MWVTKLRDLAFYFSKQREISDTFVNWTYEQIMEKTEDGWLELSYSKN